MKKYKDFKEFYKKYTSSKNKKKPKRTSSSSILSFLFNKSFNTDNICSYCKKPFDKRLWCEECDPRNIIEGWTSEDIKVDKFIKATMYNARNNDSYFNHFLEWVPYERLANIEQIGEGGYFKVYSSIWVDGKSTCINKPIDKSFRRVSNLKPLIKVVLKRLNLSQNGMPNLFLNKLKLHWNINLKDINNHIKFYGMSKDPNTGEFIIITEFADQGNLRDFLSTRFNRLLWKDKISLLSEILLSLSYLHKSGYFHKNLHSGNILMIDGCAHISDFALSGSINEQDNKVYGVLPYIAPEVLIGEPYTSSSDIYSFGIIMTELSSGKPPFYDKCHDLGLVSAICKGLRPKFGFATPKAFRRLAIKCMNSNPDKRPTADELDNILKFWYRSIISDLCYHERDLFGYKGNEIKAMFKDSDQEIPVISTSYRKNPYAIYISRAFDFTNLLKHIERSIVSYRSSSEKYINRELKKPKSMYISRSKSDNEFLFERKPNSVYISRSKSNEPLYERNSNSIDTNRPSIDSTYEDETSSEGKQNSLDINRPSINSIHEAETSYERKQNYKHLKRPSIEYIKEAETSYERKQNYKHIKRPSIDSINEVETTYERKQNSIHINRSSIDSKNDDEVSYYDRKLISMYLNRPSISVNEEEISYVRNIDSIYINHINRLSVSSNKDEISYGRMRDSLYNNRPLTIETIDEVDERKPDSTYNNLLPSTINEFSKSNSFSGISYLNDSEEGTIISPYHNIYF